MSELVTAVTPVSFEVMLVTAREVIVILRDEQHDETWLRIPMEMAGVLARTLVDAGMARGQP